MQFLAWAENDKSIVSIRDLAFQPRCRAVKGPLNSLEGQVD
jgi:hypothetical protein